MTGPTASVAVGVNVAFAPAELVASSTMFAGTVSTGATVSTTVTTNDADEWFPDASVAVTVTVVVPNGSTVPADLL